MNKINKRDLDSLNLKSLKIDQLNNTIRTVNPTTTRDLTPIESRSSGLNIV